MSDVVGDRDDDDRLVDAYLASRFGIEPPEPSADSEPVAAEDDDEIRTEKWLDSSFGPKPI